MTEIEISVVVPVYGCPDALPELHRRLVDTLSRMKTSYEIILVDDYCPYGSWPIIRKICEQDKLVKGIHLSKNFGQGRAITAGVAEANGKWIITMDCDLQDSPEMIPDLYMKANEGYDIVFVRRKDRKVSKMTQLWAKLYHKTFTYLSEVNFDFDLATYLISSRRAAEQFLASKDRGRDYGMYLMWLGYEHAFIDMEHGERHSGKSSYTFVKKMKYAVGIMTGYSNRILYIPIYFGLASAIVSVFYLIYVFYLHFCLNVNPEGWTTIVASIFLFGGLILSTLGTIGVYLGNVYEIGKDRPLFVIQEKMNCD